MRWAIIIIVNNKATRKSSSLCHVTLFSFSFPNFFLLSQHVSLCLKHCHVVSASQFRIKLQLSLVFYYLLIFLSVSLLGSSQINPPCFLCVFRDVCLCSFICSALSNVVFPVLSCHYAMMCFRLIFICNPTVKCSIELPLNYHFLS